MAIWTARKLSSATTCLLLLIIKRSGCLASNYFHLEAIITPTKNMIAVDSVTFKVAKPE